MVNTTKILTELLGNGKRGSGSLNSGSGAKMLEDLLGVGGGANNTGGGVFGGGSQQTGGGGSRNGDQQQSGGGISGGPFGGGQTQRPSASGGALGDLLGKALKEITKGPGGRGGGSTGQHSGTAVGGNPFEVPAQVPSIQKNDQSDVYLRAMIQAGLSDGRVDEQEQQAILQKTGVIGQAESEFIRAEMARGCNVNEFIQTVPRGIEEDVYAVSLMAVSLDNQSEAQYLDALAKGLRITQDQCNAIHDRLGAQRLYR